jgi:hypothetical protein
MMVCAQDTCKEKKTSLFVKSVSQGSIPVCECLSCSLTFILRKLAH